jgi:hypothetical protein
MRRTCLILAAALCAAATAFAQPMPGPALPLPTMAGGPCGNVKQVPMPMVKSQLLYWRCTDGREVYFHVRDGWMSGTQDADKHDENRAELLGLHARAQADKVDALMRREVLRALAKVRAETA